MDSVKRVEEKKRPQRISAGASGYRGVIELSGMSGRKGDE